MSHESFKNYIESDDIYNLSNLISSKNFKMYIDFCKFLQEKIDFININFFNDIHEFLTYFLDKMKDDTKIDGLKINNEFERTMYNKLKYKCDKYWYERDDFSKLMDIVYMETITQTECGKCNKIWQNLEINSILEIDIKENDNLYDAIRRYIEPIKVVEWKCDHCLQKSMLSKKNGIFWKLPELLIICLKRFKYEHDKFEKIEYEFDFPMNIDLDNFVLKKENYKYQLYAVANHYGNYRYGHYNATIISDDIYIIDDLKVFKGKIDKKNAYILFYKKITN